MPDLNEAIQFIRQGRKEEARRILEPLIKIEPGNIQAWFWYVETCTTIQQRIQILEICLKMNPGNSQVTQALQALKGQQMAKPEFAPPTAPPPKPMISKQQETPSYTATYDDSSSYASPSYQPVHFDDPPEPIQPQPVAKQKPAWEQDSDAYVDTSMLSKPKRAARSYTFYSAWTTVLLSTDIESYADVLDDPEAGAGRAFEWIAYTGLVSGLVSPLYLLTNPDFTTLTEMPEFRQIFGNAGTNTFFILMLAVAMMLLVPLFSVIGLAFNGAIYNFLAITFGGNGTYGRTVYALAAYMAPVTLLTSLLSIIPVAGQCIASLLGIYNIVLTVRALRAAHSLSVGTALAVMFAPGIIFMILGCLIVLVVGLPAMGR